jgi:hypothetical protein
MANWKTKVDIFDLNCQFEADEITAKEYADQLANRLERNKYAKDEELKDIISDLRDAQDEDDVDSVLYQLYEYGDYDHRIWINPFPPVVTEKPNHLRLVN